jgi:hypothetical protein
MRHVFRTLRRAPSRSVQRESSLHLFAPVSAA